MDDSIQNLKELPEVSFIDDDTLEEMSTRMINNYQDKYLELTGETVSLSKADPIRTLLYAVAMELYQIEQYVDRAGKQDLLKYSYGEFLDSLGANRGVTRKQASVAITTLKFTLSGTRTSAVSIPEGTLVTNGVVYFSTDEYVEIAAGESSVNVGASCIDEGEVGNGLLAGEVNEMVDLIPYIDSVTNLSETSGGRDIETDEELAERILLVPASYSVAGPDDAYKYWVKTYSSAIGDINISSPNPMEVAIRILMDDGALPTTSIINGLQEFLADNNIRPLTDKVTVLSPTEKTFNINLTYYINKSDSHRSEDVKKNVENAISEYIKWQTTAIGRAINPSELISKIMQAGAKRVVVLEPIYQIVGEHEVARLGSKNITYGGMEK